jgi:hypothetical protein
MLSLDDVLTLAPGVISRQSDDELVVVLPMKGKYVVLNSTGAETFQLLDGQRTLGEITSILNERHGVSQERVRIDVLALAEKLLDRGAVIIHQP